MRNDASMNSQLLSDDEVQTMVLAALAASDPEPVQEDDLRSLVDWAQNATIDHGLLQNVLEGRMLWTWNGEEPVFSLSKKGREVAEKISASTGHHE